MARRYPERGKRRAGGQPFHRRHRRILVAVLAAVVVIPVLGTAAYAYVLNSKLGAIDTVPSLADADRPDPDEGKALNILLIGSDKGEPQPGEDPDTTVAEDAAAAQWPSGKYRSDTLMVVHITEDRRNAYLTSIPRDSYVPIYDADGKQQSTQKINDAFSEYGPLGTQSTVEHLTDLRMDHLAIIDWDGFKDLSTAVGGVPVSIPASFYDPKQDIQWEAGDQVLEGAKALAYVRTRYGLANGDFDRIARQQNFLRSLMTKILSKGTMSSPTKLLSTVSALTENLTVDDAWSAGDMRGLALSLRNIRTDDVTFLTAPVAGTETIPVYGSVVNLDPVRSQELFSAIRGEGLTEYLAKYPDDELATDDQIS